MAPVSVKGETKERYVHSHRGSFLSISATIEWSNVWIEQNDKQFPWIFIYTSEFKVFWIALAQSIFMKIIAIEYCTLHIAHYAYRAQNKRKNTNAQSHRESRCSIENNWFGRIRFILLPINGMDGINYNTAKMNVII